MSRGGPINGPVGGTLGETIAALASPAGASPRAIIRLSGSAAFAIASAVLAEPAALSGPGFRRVEAAFLIPQDAAWPAVRGALYRFEAPRSYTGEDVVELHVPGSPPWIAALLRALRRAGARDAAPGEFTRRAFINGRLDLTQAEAVLAMTSGEQAAAVALAARTLRGGLRERIDAAKEALIELVAYVEAGIDFSEDEVDLLSPAAALDLVDRAREVLRDVLARSARFGAQRAEPIVALRGRANAGKSTLVNALAGEERAVTSPQAGTTRDVVGTRVSLGGLRLRLVDVAGEKEAADALEEEALARSRAALEDADLVLHLRAADERERGEAESLLAAAQDERELVVVSKGDLLGASARRALPPGALVVSSVSGEGLAELAARIRERFAGEGPGLAGLDFVTSARQAGLLEACLEALAQASESLALPGEERWELAMVDLHEALAALGEVTGAVATDDILDAIFGRFCIGK